MRQTLRRPAATLLIAALMVLATAGARASTPRPDDGSALGSYASQVRDDLGVPGLAVAVLDDDGGVVEQTSAGDRLDRRTPVVMGSVAKSMTATLVLQQSRAGVVDLDDRVGRLLPWSDLDAVTVRQLLTHTSGFTALDGLAVSERYDERPGAVRRAAEDLERSGPAGGYAYSSANYLLLGALVEELAGRPFADVLERELLDPLGMDATTARADEAAPTTGHRWLFGFTSTVRHGLDESGGPYAQVVSTLEDLGVWAAAQSGTRPDVLPPALLRELHAPQVGSDVDRYGFGWRVRDDGVVHHTGAVPGFFTHVLVRPADGRSVVVVADAYGEAQAPALGAIAGDALTISDGGSAAPSAPDPVLGVLPWVAAGLALLGAVAALAALRRPHGRGPRLVLALVAGLGAVALWRAPVLIGLDLGTLTTWAPDVGWSLVAAVATWTLLAVVLVLRRSRPRVRAAQSG